VIEPSFLGFPMNRLAANDNPPGDVLVVASFPLFVWFISGVVVLELDFYCTYTIGMTRLVYNYLIGGNYMNS